jgi:hypothetical protein
MKVTEKQNGKEQNGNGQRMNGTTVGAPPSTGHAPGENKLKGVWSIVENERLERPIWVRVGTGFVNRDNSVNVYLDAHPVNGRLHIRDLEPRPATGEHVNDQAPEAGAPA